MEHGYVFRMAVGTIWESLMAVGTIGEWLKLFTF